MRRETSYVNHYLTHISLVDREFQWNINMEDDTE